MKLSEPYEDDGKWYCNVIDPEEGVDVRPKGIELKTRSSEWAKCGGEGCSAWVRGYEYRIPVKPPEPKIEVKDPYAGLTLPTPPAGYRLAKWGEEFSPLAGGTPLRWWWGPQNQQWQYIGWILPTDYTEPEKSIYAVPIDPPASPAPKSWQFRHDPWVPPQPKTLADCIPDVDVVVAFYEDRLCIRQRTKDNRCVFSDGAQDSASTSNARFVRYLDPPQPAPLRLEDVPDGRVIFIDDREHWKTKSGWLRLHRDGTIREAQASVDFTVTDYIAEFREASC